MSWGEGKQIGSMDFKSAKRLSIIFSASYQIIAFQLQIHLSLSTLH